MSHAKQTRPNRCYCRVHDEGVSLNDIAKIITTLNYKTQRLRNEVNAFKNVDANDEKKLSKESEGTRERKSVRCCARQPDIFSSNAKLDNLAIPDESDNLTDSYEIRQGNVDNKLGKIRKKRICRGVQCDSVIERKRKRNLFTCFKSRVKEYKLLQDEKDRNSQNDNIHAAFDVQAAKNELPHKRKKRDTMLKNMQRENYDKDQSLRSDEDDEKDTLDRTISWTSVKINPKREKETLNQFKKSQKNNIFETTLNEAIVKTNKENEQAIECLATDRMGGGAEFHGSRFISDFNNKMQKICLYKNVKFDAMNVRKRLDACISELNGIIDDVSLIFKN